MYITTQEILNMNRYLVLVSEITIYSHWMLMPTMNWNNLRRRRGRVCVSGWRGSEWGWERARCAVLSILDLAHQRVFPLPGKRCGQSPQAGLNTKLWCWVRINLSLTWILQLLNFFDCTVTCFSFRDFFDLLGFCIWITYF